MKKKKFTGQISWLLGIAMMSSLLAGCGGSTDSPQQRDTETKEVPSSQEATDAGETKSEADPLKGPGNVTLSFLGFNLDFDPNADVMAGVIEEATGYKTQYSMLPSDGAEIGRAHV